MITRAHRFHGHGSLRYVYQHGRTIRTPMFSLTFTANPKRDTYRAAVVVSKKTSKLAVVRNRLRRRLFEALRQHEASLGVYDIVITVHQDTVAALPSDKLQASLKKALLAAGILAN